MTYHVHINFLELPSKLFQYFCLLRAEIGASFIRTKSKKHFNNIKRLLKKHKVPFYIPLNKKDTPRVFPYTNN